MSPRATTWTIALLAILVLLVAVVSATGSEEHAEKETAAGSGSSSQEMETTTVNKEEGSSSAARDLINENTEKKEEEKKESSTSEESEGEESKHGVGSKTHAVFAGEEDEESINSVVKSAPIVCVCRCCYLGDCNPLHNASWFVQTCSDCTTDLCRAHIKSSTLRTKTARTFESLQDGVPEEARAGIEVDVCEVISVLEAATCLGAECKRTTDVKAECYDRNAPVQKYSIWLFVTVIVVGVTLGFTKNYIPALQEFNARNFDY